MTSKKKISAVFAAAAVYDGVLGTAFLLLPGAVLRMFHVEPPGHTGYLQFPGVLLLVFALMFVAIARRPKEQRGLIPYSILFKLAYAGVVIGHWVFATVPNLWKPFAVVDLIFAVLFALSHVALRKEAA